MLSFSLSCRLEGDLILLPVEFSPSYDVGVISKSSAFVAGDSFGVYAYHRKNGVLPDSKMPDFMKGIEVSFDGSIWRYSPQMYWPQNEADKISFIAYSPYSYGDSPMDVDISAENMPVLNFDLQESGGKVDLLAAKTTTSRLDGAVNLEFQHLLCKIDVYFKHSNQGGFSTVQKITYKDIECPTRFCFADLDDPSLGSWDLQSNHEYNLGLDHDLEVVGTTEVTTDAYSVYMPPADLSGKMIVTIDGVDYVIKGDKLDGLMPGKAITIQVLIENMALVYEVSVSDWKLMEKSDPTYIY